MSYNYKDEKPKIFTEQGQRMFLEIRDRVDRLLVAAGAVTMERAIQGTTGEMWLMIACVDWLVELRELREIPTEGAEQDRIMDSQGRVFVRAW